MEEEGEKRKIPRNAATSKKSPPLGVPMTQLSENVEPNEKA